MAVVVVVVVMVFIYLFLFVFLAVKFATPDGMWGFTLTSKGFAKRNQFEDKVNMYLMVSRFCHWIWHLVKIVSRMLRESRPVLAVMYMVHANYWSLAHGPDWWKLSRSSSTEGQHLLIELTVWEKQGIMNLLI